MIRHPPSPPPFPSPPLSRPATEPAAMLADQVRLPVPVPPKGDIHLPLRRVEPLRRPRQPQRRRSEEHTSELQSPCNLVCRLLLEKKKTTVLTSARSDTSAAY